MEWKVSREKRSLGWQSIFLEIVFPGSGKGLTDLYPLFHGVSGYSHKEKTAKSIMQTCFHSILGIGLRKKTRKTLQSQNHVCMIIRFFFSEKMPGKNISLIPEGLGMPCQNRKQNSVRTMDSPDLEEENHWADSIVERSAGRRKRENCQATVTGNRLINDPPRDPRRKKEENRLGRKREIPISRARNRLTPSVRPLNVNG